MSTKPERIMWVFGQRRDLRLISLAGPKAIGFVFSLESQALFPFMKLLLFQFPNAEKDKMLT